MITQIQSIRTLKAGMPVRGINLIITRNGFPVSIFKRDSDGAVFCNQRGDLDMTRQSSPAKKHFARFMGYGVGEYIRHCDEIEEARRREEDEFEEADMVRKLERLGYVVTKKE